MLIRFVMVRPVPSTGAAVPIPTCLEADRE
jgi:hypothetical protein